MNRAAILLMMLTAVTALPGCRLFNKKETDRGDPLLGKYIPKTDLPVPGKDRRDPLLTQPTNNTRKPVVEKDTFRNTEQTSVAGLTSRLHVDPESLRDRRPEAKPTVRGVPLTRDPLDVSDDDLAVYRESFEHFKARVERPVRDANGEVTLGATVKRSDSSTRRYEGRGANAAAAARDLLEQLRAENR